MAYSKSIYTGIRIGGEINLWFLAAKVPIVFQLGWPTLSEMFIKKVINVGMGLLPGLEIATILVAYAPEM